MKISWNWIKEYLPVELDQHQAAEIITNIGHEIEEIEEWCPVEGGLDGVVIGKVLKSEKHPNADNLTLNIVDIGKEKPLQIVCGAPNIAAGQLVPVALPGSIINKGDERIEIKVSRIRGEISEGMICAEDEIGMGTSHEGIMVLSPDAVPGTSAAEYFKIEKDYVFTVGFTPNRIDSASHIGIGRDLYAYLTINRNKDIRLEIPSVADFNPKKTKNTFEVIIENTAGCKRYTALNIFDVEVAESPEWLKNKLKAVGINPINNVVDITNYVQYEVGQPLHAFDADMISGNKVIVKNLPDKTKFVTLDGIERELSSEDLMICNEKEGMCIAGVFGGIKSGVTEKTRNVFLESAYFDPVTIRRTAKRHALNTDASYRFERGADPDITEWALKRVALLIRDIAGGKLLADIRDVYPVKIPHTIINVSCDNINSLIGKKIDYDTIIKILTCLDIKIVSRNLPEMKLEIPPRKVDVKKTADVTEEILRIYGYNNVETDNHVNSILNFIQKPDRNKLINIVADLLTANGFSEIMCNSLVPSAWFENNPDFDNNSLVKLANPLSSDLNSMRQSLLFGGLATISRNINRQNYNLKFYEFGNCYFYDSTRKGKKVDRYIEKTSLDLFMTGNRYKRSWNSSEMPIDFFYLKAFIEMVLNRLGLNSGSLATTESNKSYYSESIVYLANGRPIAEGGKISSLYREKFDIEKDVFYGHIDWDYLVETAGKYSITYKELPKYPWVRRDLALLIDKSITFAQIKELAFRTEKHILKDVSLFDVYESESLGKEKKSYAVSFILQDEKRTLTDKQIDKVMNQLIKVFTDELGAKIR
ncbi:MAG TPA: phenylalanine--tRNA ligase subunit beta [Bacteroidales bacterium]|nr:phenylalanine--tRNA ligase subunit beta [Bacteroidales bacterium]HQG35773.1 phenylalanine--tRNA ligase subunit beta [Bacteroidales bacterium]HRC88478.1 phenylalanine--tRNA ligase subunit beta [Bacteroidales bacterium]